MKLDMHTHCNSADPVQLERFVAQCRSLDTRVCYCPVGPRGDHTSMDNAVVLDAHRAYPDMIVPVAFVDLWESVDLDAVRRLIDEGFKGFKCITPYWPYDADEYMPFYELAQQSQLPILFHTGNYRPDASALQHRRPLLMNMHPLRLDRIARSFQDLIVIAAHMGTSFFRSDAANLALLHKNLYVDLAGSGNFATVGPDELCTLLGSTAHHVNPSFAGFKKLILGSDGYTTHVGPLSAAQHWYSMTLQRCSVPEDIIADIMGNTAAAWYGVS